MTNREIKFELAKIALSRCSYTYVNDFNAAIRYMYDWIVEEPEVDVEESNVDVEKPKTDYDKTSVREIIKYLDNNNRYSDKRYASSLVNVFNDNEINTVGDILRIGRREFMQIKGVGKGSVTRIDDALEELYGIVNWNK